MFKIQKPLTPSLSPAGRGMGRGGSFGHWSLEFIWDLGFVIWDLNNFFGLLNGISSKNVLALF